MVFLAETSSVLVGTGQWQWMEAPPAGTGGRNYSVFVAGLARDLQAGFFGALDLGHMAVMDGQLHHAIAQALDLLAHKREPVRGGGGNGGAGGGGAPRNQMV